MTQEQAKEQIAEIVNEFEQLKDTFFLTNSIGEAGFTLGSFYYNLLSKLSILNQYISQEERFNSLETKN